MRRRISTFLHSATALLQMASRDTPSLTQEMEEDRSPLYPYLLLCLAVIAADVLLVMTFNPPSFSTSELGMFTDPFPERKTDHHSRELLTDTSANTSVLLDRCMDQAKGTVRPSLDACTVVDCDDMKGCSGFVYQRAEDAITEDKVTETRKQCCMVRINFRYEGDRARMILMKFELTLFSLRLPGF